jgi:hypothetical protein
LAKSYAIVPIQLNQFKAKIKGGDFFEQCNEKAEKKDEKA